MQVLLSGSHDLGSVRALGQNSGIIGERKERTHGLNFDLGKDVVLYVRFLGFAKYSVQSD